MTEKEELCLVRMLPNGIQEFVIANNSREAIDAYIEAVTQAWAEQTFHDGEMGRVLIDIRQAEHFPMVYVYNRFRHLVQRYPEQIPVRAVYLHNKQFIFRIAQTLVTLLRFNLYNIQFFSDRDEAIRWLLKAHEMSS